MTVMSTVAMTATNRQMDDDDESTHRREQQPEQQHPLLLSPRSKERKQRIVSLLHEAAAKACAQDDPWGKYQLENCKAERIKRHLYDPISQQWYTDETIVKMESKPFTNGAMRHCYRLKKRAQPPQSATNHRFHRTGWRISHFG